MPARVRQDVALGSDEEVGVLVMAHGGTPSWNASVLDGVKEIDDELPTVVAFGMADPTTLAQGLDSLASLGVERVAVVRLFVSGASFYARTAYVLGLPEATPEASMAYGGASGDAMFPAGAAHGMAEPTPLAHDLKIATHTAGLMGSAEISEILVDRARGVSQSPPDETVLLIAHGMGTERENRRLIEAMGSAAEAFSRLGYARVETATLREDWPAPRADAEREIRDFVSSEAIAGRTVLVLPYRLSGFGPYAEVLEGLDYVGTEGFLPHPALSAWIRRTASGILCDNGWSNVLGRCGG